MTMDRDPDTPLFKNAVLVQHKADYIKRKGEHAERKNYTEQQAGNCIICKVIAKDPDTPGYEVFRNDKFIIFLNLFPYTSGHLMISPLEHLTTYEDFPATLISELGLLTQKVIILLRETMNAQSVNVGWNQGPNAGGSIKHWHMHVVPRYPNELNFMETIAQTRPIIQSLEDTQRELREHIDLLDQP